MIVLAIFAVGSGFVFNGLWDIGPVPAHWFAHFFDENAPELVTWIAVLSMVVAISGISFAVAMYGLKPVSLHEMLRPHAGLHRVLEQRYFMDYLYETVIVRRVLHRGIFAASDWADRKIVDGAVDFVGWAGRNAGKFIAQIQTGQVQAYGIAVSVGAIVLLWAFLGRS
jgi:NADH-quinone oxidoreductase subunit L